KLPQKILIISLALLQRIQFSSLLFKGSLESCKKLSLTALILACKCSFDQPVNFKGWNKICPEFSISNLFEMESEFLRRIRYDIVVSVEEFSFIQKIISLNTFSSESAKKLK